MAHNADPLRTLRHNAEGHDGERKRKRARELEVATATRNTLRYRQSSQGAVAVLEREDALEQTNARIGKAEAFKTIIEARKAVIAAQG